MFPVDEREHDPPRCQKDYSRTEDFPQRQPLSGQSSYFLIVETTTPVASFFQPAIDGIPADAFDAGDGGLIQAFDAQRRHLIKGVAAMLKSIVRSSGRGAECLLAALAAIPTASSPTCLIETKTDDVSGAVFWRWLAGPVRAAVNSHDVL